MQLLTVHARRHRVRRRYRAADNLLVNLGAGAEGRTGWVNVDVCGDPSVDCVYDCRKSLPFPDESVRGIFCEHFLEHIDYTEELPYFLSECHRVLKKGGILRVIVPDAEKYLRAYCDGGWEKLSQLRPLDADRSDSYFHCKYNTPLELINVVFRQGHEHKFAYDLTTLLFVLQRYGFEEVAHQEYGRCLLPDLCLDQVLRSSESLYVDARK
jgi:predicted SAM-dependent methyltransferase